MSDPIFAFMKTQMNPSAQAQKELMDKLTQAAPIKRKLAWKRYVAVAACAALALCVASVYHMIEGAPTPKLHSYVTVEGGNSGIVKGTLTEEGGTVTGNGTDKGDRDQAMTPGELTEAMEKVGFSTADIDVYQAMGYEMTWAKWWKFVDEQRNTEGEEPFNLAGLEEFSRKELSINTRLVDELPGGAYCSAGESMDEQTQPGADAYQLLMDHFGGTLPDWYGGAYVTSRGTLMVLLVNDKDSGDKTLELEVMEAAGGRTAPVGFAGAKYSRNDLERLNSEILALLDGKGIHASWGIYDEQNRVVLDTSEVLPDELLAELARLDPDGDAILVRVIAGNTTMVTDESVKGPAPIKPGGDMRAEPNGGSVGEEKGNEMQTYSALPALTEDGDKELEAVEPRGDDLPEANEDPTYHRDEQSVHYDLLPLPRGGAE